jgi:ABC-type dipeptide/oligopeptide/nickel transport system permease subunit
MDSRRVLILLTVLGFNFIGDGLATLRSQMNGTDVYP